VKITHDYIQKNLVPFEDLPKKGILSGIGDGTGCLLSGQKDSFYSHLEVLNCFEYCSQRYLALLDPNDGYRSYLEGLVKVPGYSKNRLPNLPVTLRVYDDGFEGVTFHFNSVEILRIGTEEADDYYPCGIFYWSPQSLARHVKEFYVNELPIQNFEGKKRSIMEKKRDHLKEKLELVHAWLLDAGVIDVPLNQIKGNQGENVISFLLDGRKGIYFKVHCFDIFDCENIYSLEVNSRIIDLGSIKSSYEDDEMRSLVVNWCKIIT